MKSHASFLKITENIAVLNKLLVSHRIRLVFTCKSRNADFVRVPSKLRVSIQQFTHWVINKDKLFLQVGSLSALYIKSNVLGFTTACPGIEYYCSNKVFLEERTLSYA